ncbi:MAG: hypothetical protein ACI4QD_04295 [Kiritimatiellia bacterium]
MGGMMSGKEEHRQAGAVPVEVLPRGESPVEEGAMEGAGAHPIGTLSECERLVLTRLQRCVPICPRPYAQIALEAGWREEEVPAFLARLRRKGLVRRVGGVFDARRLGYRSVLCALEAPTEALSGLAGLIRGEPGVTHIYERRADESALNFWFTLAEFHAQFPAAIQRIERALSPLRVHLLPALRRYKIDVTFALSTRERDEFCPPPPPAGESCARTFSEREKAIIRLVGGDFPDTLSPFDSLARGAGIPEAELLSRLQAWRDEGILRRVAALLYHQRAGFKGNAMCCWDIPERVLDETGRTLATFPEVTHCYSRPRSEPVPYSLYAMLHAADEAQALVLAARIAHQARLPPPTVFLSRREFKKTSMQFFRPYEP